MLGRLVDWFVGWWKCGIPVREKSTVDVIVPISYTTCKDRLTDATHINLMLALGFFECFPSAKLAFSNCSYQFEEAASIESRFKRKILIRELAQIETITGFFVDVHEADSMVNSVDEAMQIRSKLASVGIKPRGILVVTGEMHSRSAKYIWEKTFPDSKIYLELTGYTFETQPDHPVLAQRSVYKWIISNILRQMALRVLPLNFVRKIQHRPVK